VNTVSTHTHHLYAKLGVHSRHEAVGRARALGLLGPPAGAESGRAAEDSGTSGLAARLM